VEAALVVVVEVITNSDGVDNVGMKIEFLDPGRCSAFALSIIPRALRCAWVIADLKATKEDTSKGSRVEDFETKTEGRVESARCLPSCPSRGRCRAGSWLG